MVVMGLDPQGFRRLHLWSWTAGGESERVRQRNLSQRINRRSSPNRRLIRSSWRTVKAMDVLLIPPGPTRAIGEAFGGINNCLDRLVTSKEYPGWWRRQFPRFARCKHKTPGSLGTKITDLFWVWVAVNVYSIADGVQVILTGRSLPPVPS